ncbi:hypothetical protein DFH07DRAFT_942010 [Mycena maculata]|uniref:Zn(2)-C6 fungal-type domain-containing protein n=1 Tax=Mycena maculata TaxID=230809 RepID=A0AAD7N929_9AGAR|nr:hypothetical protein DFH07DRAFT_942010 [Mycena maculata]
MTHYTPETFALISSIGTRKKKKKRADLACVQCRRLKKKCIRPNASPLPPCKRCTARGLNCQYLPIVDEHTQPPSTSGPGESGPNPTVLSGLPAAGSQSRTQIYDQYPRVDPVYAAPSQFVPTGAPQPGRSLQPYFDTSSQFSSGHAELSQSVPPSDHQDRHSFQPHSGIDHSGQYHYDYGGSPHSQAFLDSSVMPQPSAPSGSQQEEPTVDLDLNRPGYDPNQYNVISIGLDCCTGSAPALRDLVIVDGDDRLREGELCI